MDRRNFISKSASLGIGLSLASVGCVKSKDAEIIILGAGLSGLTLALQLQDVGKDVIILEGSGRLGGRMFMHPELHRDVGGRGIGDRYDEFMKWVKRLDVPLVDITSTMRSATAIYRNGNLYNEWTLDTPNPRTMEYANERVASLHQLDEWFQRKELDIPYADFLMQSGLSMEQVDVVNLNANYNDVYATSALNSLHSSAFRKFNGSKKIYNFKGGTGSFINALHKQINFPIKLNKLVTKISEEVGRMKIVCEDGSTYSASKVVSTLPFSTLRDVDLNVALSHNQKKAINELGYTLITQIHLNAKEAYWESDGMPASMWTDTPLERIMDMESASDAFEMVCWVNGKGTAFFDKMTDKEIADYTINKLAEIRPATEDKLEYVGTHSWGKYKYNKGAYAEFQTGQIPWFEDMIRPAGNLFFAGEHTAKESRGLEGAAESASRVFKELIA